MSAKKRLLKTLSMLCVFIGLVYGLGFTAGGIRWLTTVIVTVRTQGRMEVVSLPRIEGNILKGIIYHDVHLRPVLPNVTSVKIVIARCEIYVRGLNGRKVKIVMRDARAELPFGDPVVMSGQVKGGRWDMAIQGRAADLRNVPVVFPKMAGLNGLAGQADMDISLTGELSDPRFRGEFRVRQGRFAGVDFEAQGDEDLTYQPDHGAVSLLGVVRLRNAGGQAHGGSFILPSADLTFKRGIYHFELEMKNVEWTSEDLVEKSKIPAGTVLKVQRVLLSSSSANLNDMEAEVENGRLQFPDSEPLLFWGQAAQGKADFKISCQSLGVGEIVDRLRTVDFPRVLGSLRDVELTIGGAYQQPQVTGSFFIVQLDSRGGSLAKAPAQLRISPDLLALRRWSGKVSVSEGDVVARGTRVKLKPSEVTFSGMNNLELNIKGEAKVDDVKIDLAIRGPRDNLDVQLSSVPSRPQETLLLMLATGKSWPSSSDLVTAQSVAPDVARDFVDYFILGGAGSRMADKFGIRSVSVQYERDKKGIAVKKAVTDSFEVGYGVEQQTVTEQQKQRPTVVHTIGGEYQVTEQVSVGVEKEMKKTEPQPADGSGIIGTTPAEPPLDDKVFIKYRTKF